MVAGADMPKKATSPSDGPIDWSEVPDDSVRELRLVASRLALYGRVITIISGSFFVWNAVLSLGAVGYPLIPYLTSLANIAHVVAILIAAATWASARRLARSERALVWLDVCSLVAQTAAYAAIAPLAPESPDQLGSLYTALLASLLVVLARAIIVPSTASRTLLASIAALVPVVSCIGVALWYARHDVGMTAIMTTYMVIWCAAGVAVATLASRIIYGLRARVREATQLGQYVLEEVIGRGGMGIVYRARHALLRRPTAVKLLPPGSAGTQALARFEREVQQTARLTHPNTIAVFDYGHTPDGLFYYAMEYLDGITLEELVELDGPMPAARVRHVLVQICGALAEAHAAGLVHRDIKPANVMLCDRGGIPDLVKVLDFGLVKELATSESAQLSTAATLVGTPAYLPPEAVTAPESMDQRADLYALGATAYHLLVGAPPFAGRTLVEICSKHLSEEPVPPSARAKSPVPRSLDDAILRCLAKDPAARPQSADELRALLEVADDIGSWTTVDARTWWRERGADACAKARTLRKGGGTPDRKTIAAANASTVAARARR